MDDTRWEQLSRYLSGEGSPEERAALETWLVADPRRAEAVRALRDVVAGGTPEEPPPADIDAMWAAVRPSVHADRQLAHGQIDPLPIPVAPSSRRELPGIRHVAPGRVMGIAAASIAGALVAVFLTSSAHRTSTQPFREFTTAAGNQATVTLRDGTRLVLGPATRLRVPVDFGRVTRTVTLDGEGYFTVVHDAAHPFAVQTARTVIRDVGTTFSVRAYAEDVMEHVAVTEGEVAVGAGQAVALRARDVAVIDRNGRVHMDATGDAGPDLAWVQGGLAFRDTPLTDVARDVGRAFDLEVVIADSGLAGQLVTATFGRETADDVLDDITYALGARYDRLGRRVTIRRRSSHADRDEHGQPRPPLLTDGSRGRE